MDEPEFRVEEATIAQLHSAIRSGATTCVEVVEQHLERVRAYNGVTTRLVTPDGGDCAPAPGPVRGGQAVRFPTETVAASTVLPDLEHYRGTPIEFGRMEPTASDPDVHQQFGMLVGIPDAGGVNALSTLNIRGERSVTCRGDYDRHPSLGPLPPSAPPACEFFRHLPDAVEQAAALDAAHGREPDLDRMPMYGVVFSFKDAFDTKDMRSTGGADAAFDIDFPRGDHPLVARLRERGAIIFAKAVMTEYNGRGGDPGGPHQPERLMPSLLGYQRSTWGGCPSNPYDTTRSASLGSSSGSAVSVGTSMVMAGLGEETRASCRGPANHNAIALVLPHKALLGFSGRAIGADIYVDRAGIMSRSVADCATILDALRNPRGGYYDPLDPFTTVPRSAVLRSYSAYTSGAAGEGALAGVRLGIVGESFAVPAGSRAEEPIVTAAAEEVATVLGGVLGAELVAEASDPTWERFARVARMRTGFREALARLVPVFMPELLFRLGARGEPLFPEVAAAVRPTEFEAGRIFGSGTLAPIDYLRGLVEGRIGPPSDLQLGAIQQQEQAMAFRFHIAEYLARRAAGWAELGLEESLADWPALNDRSKFWGEDQRAAFGNWELVTDMRNPPGRRQGISERIVLRELLRRVDMMVILENDLDVLVRLHTPFPPAKIGGAPQPRAAGHGPRGQNLLGESFTGPNAGLSEVLVPAGYVTTVYDPVFALAEGGDRYVARPGPEPTALPEPGLPYSLVFRCEPGKEDGLLRIASAYEAASRRRIPPPNFGRPGPAPRAPTGEAAHAQQIR